MGDRAGRKGWLLLLVFLGLTIVVINVSHWFVLSRATRAVEDELGRRLVTVATTAVATATPELLLAPDVADDPFVRRVLDDVAQQHDLDDVFLADPSGNVLWDLEDRGLGGPSPFLELDLDAFRKAAAGEPSASPTVDADGVVLKAAFAPVEDWDGTVEAVLGVTAGGGFHATVPGLRRSLLGVAAGSAALVVVLGAVFFGMSRRLAVTEAALSRSETLSAMGMMAAGVAHEVRNPLAIIAGTAMRLKKRYAPTDPPDPLFDFIPEEVERLDEIVEGYLRFARDEPLAFVDCDLRDVVERGERLVRDELASRHVELSRRVPAEPVPARADPQRLQQVLLNLLLNAAQAMPRGGEVELSLEEAGSRAVVRVADRGPGFGEKELKSAFTPFYTTKEKGSGLGLVMTRRIVEAHGGAVRVENRDGGGAVVTIELPLGRC
jgi:signal transduction histidine kinase